MPTDNQEEVKLLQPTSGKMDTTKKKHTQSRLKDGGVENIVFWMKSKRDVMKLIRCRTTSQALAFICS